MSLYNFNPVPAPWTSPGITPTLNFGAPTGLASLPGASGGVLARGLSPAASRLGSLFTGSAGAGGGLPRLGTTAASLAEDVAGLGGGAGGLLSRLPAVGGLPGFAAVSGRAAGLGGAAALAGSQLVDQLNVGGQNSNLEQGLQGATAGAALGATIGAPFFGVGAGVGAAAGGVIGGALGVLGNVLGFGGGEDDKPEPLDILTTGIQKAGLSPDQAEQVLQVYETQMALAEVAEGDEKKALQQQAYDAAASSILMLMQQQEAALMGGGTGNLLALQAQAQDIFAPLAADIESSGAAYGAAMNSINQYLPEQFRAINDANVARELSSSNKLANAYRAQAAIIPTVNALTQYQQDYNALAQQMFQRAQAESMGTGGTGTTGAGDQLAALLG